MKILLLLVVTLTRSDSSSVHDHYVDDHCEGHFQVEVNTNIFLVRYQIFSRWRQTRSSAQRTASTWAGSSSMRPRRWACPGVCTTAAHTHSATLPCLMRGRNNFEGQLFSWCTPNIFHYRMDSTEGGSCYLFDCGSLDNLKCQFTTNPDFSAAVLDIDRHKFDISADDQRQGHSNQLELLRSREGAEPQVMTETICFSWK